MDTKLTPLKYYNYFKRTIILVFLPWMVTLVYLLTKEETECFNPLFIVIPSIISAIIMFSMRFFRKIFIGNLIAVEMDFNTVYEIEKRSKKHKIHNLKLLINVAFYNGNFNDVITLHS